MKILAIETSCDETAISIVEAKGGLKNPRFKVLKNLVASQIETHRPYGGVVPMLAKREHQKNLPILLRQIFRKAQSAKRTKRKKDDLRLALSDLPAIDTIAVTVGPGLDPCLWTGIEFAKKVAEDLNKPLIGANHLEGHLYSNWLPQVGSHPDPPAGGEGSLTKSRDSSPRYGGAQNDKAIKFPAIALIVSGGHTILLYMTSLTKWKKLGETRDDAAGEAFDKVARLLGLPYPGGPEIEKLARKGNPKAINFPRPMLAPRRSFSGINQKNHDFSFSGLKTSVLYYLRDNPRVDKADVAASFQEAVVDVLVQKTIRAAQAFRAKSVLLCGGVAANKALRQEFKATLRKQSFGKLRIKFHVPDMKFNTDNAAMIAAAAYIRYLQKKRFKLVAQPNLNL